MDRALTRIDNQGRGLAHAPGPANAPMNALNQIDDMDDAPHHSEITLGTATLLGIFLGLVLVCAVFFGFGYSLGRRSIQTSPAGDAATSSTDFGSFKPSAGNSTAPSAPPSTTASAPRNRAAKVSASTEADDGATRSDNQTEAPSASISRTQPVSSTAKMAATTRPAVASTASTSNVASQFAQPSAALMVQIAAVSHQEDADVLVKALKRQGHDVIARQDPADRLIHVQLGPFASRKEADAMRQTLQTEGYNAIVK